MVVHIEQHNGTPTPFLDGKPMFAGYMWTRAPKNEGYEQASIAKQYADAGIHLYAFDVGAGGRTPEWCGPGPGRDSHFDLSTVEGRLGRILDVDPDARFHFRVYLEMRQQWWYNMYPEEREVDSEGTLLTQSFASAVWREQAKDFIMGALADGDKFKEELAAFTREAGISDRTLAAALKELATAKLIIGTLEGRKKKYSIFEPLQPLQPIYNTLQGLQRSHPGNLELTSEEKELLVKHWTDRGKPTVILGQSQWFNLEAMLYSTDNYLAQKRRDHTPALRQILVRWSNNHMEVPNESIEVRS